MRKKIKDLTEDEVKQIVKGLMREGFEVQTEEVKPEGHPDQGTYLVLGCVHVPGHNRELMSAIYDMCEDNKTQLNGLILLGDFLDCASLSSYGTGKLPIIPGLTLEEEYSIGESVLNNLLAKLPLLNRKIYLYGNHEDRYNRYMNDAENSKRPLPSPAKGLGLYDKGFEIYDDCYNDTIRLGDHLELIHGQYYNVHCAKKHMDVYRSSLVFCHTHRIQSYIEGRVGSFNIGWLGNVDSPFFRYMPRGTRMQWQNGFAVVTIDHKGDYFIQQVICHNNKFVYNGKMYGGRQESKDKGAEVEYSSSPRGLHYGPEYQARR